MINVAFDLVPTVIDTDVSVVVLLDRWSTVNCAIQLETIDSDGGVPVMVINGTMARINRGETPVWTVLYGTSEDDPNDNVLFNSIADPGILIPVHAPLEAIQILFQADTLPASATGRVVQGWRS